MDEPTAKISFDPRARPTFPLAAFAVIPAGLLLLALVIIYVHLVGRDVSRVLADRGLDVSLESDNLTRSKELLGYLGRPSSYLEKLRWPMIPPPNPFNRLLIAKASAYFEAIPLLQTRKIDQVYNIILENQLEPFLLPDSPTLRRINKEQGGLEGLIERAKNLSAEHIKLTKEIRKDERAIEEYLVNRDSSRKQFELIGEDFRALLGFRSLSEIGITNRLLYYKEGVLKGLPWINGVPDGLKSLVELKETLERIPNLSDVRVQNPRKFRDNLDRIRKASAEAVDTFNSSVEGIIKAEQEIKELQVKTRLIRQKIKAILLDLIAVHTYRKPQPISAVLLDLAS